MRLEAIFASKIPKYILKYEKVKMGAENGFFLYVLEGHHIPEFITKKTILETTFVSEDEFIALEFPVILCNHPDKYCVKTFYEKGSCVDSVLDSYIDPYPKNIVDYYTNMLELSAVDWHTIKIRREMLRCLNAPIEDKSLRELTAKEVHELSKTVNMPVFSFIKDNGSRKGEK